MRVVGRMRIVEEIVRWNGNVRGSRCRVFTLSITGDAYSNNVTWVTCNFVPIIEVLVHEAPGRD